MPANILIIGNKAYSSWSLRGWLILRASGEAYSEVRLPLDTERFAHEIGEHSPARCVPVLKRDGFPIWDTLAIAETLAEAHPGLWPADANARARARSLCAELHAGFGALRAELPFNCRASGRNVTPSTTACTNIERVQQIWRECLGDSNGPWLFGEFGIVDAMYAPLALRFVTYGVPCEGKVADYVATVCSAPDVREWIGAAELESEVIDSEEVG